MNMIRLLLITILFSFLLGLTLAQPQQSKPKQTETNSKPLTAKEAKAKDKARRAELGSGSHTWPDQDVAYIITASERDAFNRLNNDEEREQFIEQFWLRRDPTPDTDENEFKEEHYRRIAYANERFASGKPGWRTDRGEMYIKFGPPDEIDDHSSGGRYDRPAAEGGGSTSAYPFQRWRYRHIDGIGDDIVILFVDNTMSGEFHFTTDASEIDALLYVPGAGLSLLEQRGLSDKSQRFNNTNGTHLPAAFGGTPESMNQFSLMEMSANLFRPPALKLPDLETVTSSIRYNTLPMLVRVAYFPVTEASVFTVITVQFNNRDLQFQLKDGDQKAQLEISGRIETMSRRRVATPFDDVVTRSIPQPMFAEFTRNKSIYQKIVPLAPGSFRLSITAKDVVGGNYAPFSQALTVPRLDPDHLSTSSLVLADIMEPVSVKRAGLGPFIVGDTRVRPRIDNTFKLTERVGVYLNAYNFGVSGASGRPAGEVSYELTRRDNSVKVTSFTKDLSRLPHASVSQATLQEFLDLKDLRVEPGAYVLRVTVRDRVRGESVIMTADLNVI